MSIPQNMKDAEYAWEATMEMENKEMKPLEAMEYIENPFIKFKDKQQYFPIVKAALYELEKLENDYEYLDYVTWKDSRALKIIRDKNVNCTLLSQVENVRQYNRIISRDNFIVGAKHLNLTQEEFSQLKEVL